VTHALQCSLPADRCTLLQTSLLAAGEPGGEKGCSPTVWDCKERIKKTLKYVLTSEQKIAENFTFLLVNNSKLNMSTQ